MIEMVTPYCDNPDRCRQIPHGRETIHVHRLPGLFRTRVETDVSFGWNPVGQCWAFVGQRSQYVWGRGRETFAAEVRRLS